MDLFSEAFNELLCGVDEAGRGPLAGEVYAAAVILPTNKLHKFVGVTDSKKLSESKREYYFDIIKEFAIDYNVSSSSVIEIETLNILKATHLAMQKAVLGLVTKPSIVMIDGNSAPSLPYLTETIVKGDEKLISISAASILAKVSRDRALIELDLKYPEYGFKKHKGYGTKEHMLAIEKYGIIEGVHRKTFAPINKMI